MSIFRKYLENLQWSRRGDFLGRDPGNLVPWGQLGQFLDFRKICLFSGYASRTSTGVAEAISLGRGPGHLVLGTSWIIFLDFRKICLSSGYASRTFTGVAEAISLGRGPGNLVLGASWINFWTLEKCVYLQDMPREPPLESPRRFP